MSQMSHAIDVLHQLEVMPVMAAEFLQVVAESLTEAKHLPETGKAAGHWMAPGVDDGGAREHELYQADVVVIGEHLVDKMRLAQWSMQLRALQVALGVALDLCAAEL